MLRSKYLKYLEYISHRISKEIERANKMILWSN